MVMMEAAGRDRPAFPDGPLAVTIRAVFSCPKGDHRKTAPPPRRWRTKRPDLDNVAKAALDAALGIFYLDDQQVARLTVEKYTAAQGEAPFVEMEVEAL